MALLNARQLAAPLAAIVLLLTGGCGPEEEVPLCRSDYECDPGLVCEPSGCRSACEEDADCRVGQRCDVRRVEEGLVCTRVGAER
ncbi:hypothetical protein DV096_06165 [Bradymonadaceae bacterium TMQ3]|nr:hypothetical protein DV096_06165 [Bradymonadaceae bacterium TMQ3]TXC76828.1 hypothetical protein FRC91_08890 [Bradymonadales bacterium TMQ1]